MTVKLPPTYPPTRRAEQNRRHPMDGPHLRRGLIRQLEIQGGSAVRGHAARLLRRLCAVSFLGVNGGVSGRWGRVQGE